MSDLLKAFLGGVWAINSLLITVLLVCAIDVLAR